MGGVDKLTKIMTSAICMYEWLTRVIPKVSGLNILDNNIFYNLYISKTYIPPYNIIYAYLLVYLEKFVKHCGNCDKPKWPQPTERSQLWYICELSVGKSRNQTSHTDR